MQPREHEIGMRRGSGTTVSGTVAHSTYSRVQDDLNDLQVDRLFSVAFGRAQQIIDHWQVQMTKGKGN